jgi:hypothetical protein
LVGYVRQEAANIVTAATIEASHFNNEYNQLQSAMNASTGHNHDGTAGGGAPINLTSSVTGTLPVANGGTGAATLTDGGVLLGSGTSAVTALGQATNGQLVIGSTGADPVLAALTDGEGIDTSVGAGSITIAGEDASDSNKGIATFNTGNFAVSSGDVTIKTDGVTTTEIAADAVGASELIENIQIEGYRPIVTQAGTSITLALTDADSYIRTTNGSAVTITVPPNSSVAFNIGTEIDVIQAGAGQVTFAAGGGVTVNSAASLLSLTGQYSAAVLKKVDTDEWDLIGDLA